MKGIVLLDKPPGITSHDAVQAVAHLYKERSGHTGTLDSGVTGLLVIAVGEARKLMPALVGLEKTYTGTLRLHREVPREELQKAMNSFVGRIVQLPPKRSAVARREREKSVYSFRATKVSGQDAWFECRTEAGVYVRKLCHDLGEKLGAGAHMTGLRRTRVGPFRVEDSVTLDMLRKGPEKHLRSLEAALEKAGLKKITIKEDEEKAVRNGRPIGTVPPGLKEGELVGIFLEKKVIALGLVQKEHVKVDRVLNE